MPRFKLIVFSAITGALIFSLAITSLPFAQASSPLNLGSAGNYQILSGTAITIGDGSIGIDPPKDGVSAPAVADLAAAIVAASGLSGTTVSADLGGVTYAPGVYLSPGGAAFAMTGNVILNGVGPFIFYTPAAVNITAGVVTLLNGASARNIYWIAGGAITIGASSTLEGIFMSNAAITTGASNTFTGCLLAAAAVTIGAANIFNPCPLTEVIKPTGSLSISAPSDCVISQVAPGGVATAESGDVVVTDSRTGYGVPTWTAAITSSGLSNSNHDQISPSTMGYSVVGLSNTGGISTISTNWSTLSATTLLHIVTATGAGALNSATWHARIEISVPLDQPSGAYTGSITHSVF